MTRKIEICAGSALSVRNAVRGGAFRVELCSGMSDGGTTPSYGEIKAALREAGGRIKVNVIIRPRGGDFLYSSEEADIMVDDIRMCGELGVDGVVFGCLDARGAVDKTVMRRLMDAAGDLSVTFHRAFDMCSNPMQALEDIIFLGCDRILTSGCAPTAPGGVELIARLVEKAGERISIMAGSGVNPDNIEALIRATGVNELHLSARRPAESGMLFHGPKLDMGLHMISDAEIVRRAVDAAAII